MFTVIAFPGHRCPHDIKAERILAEDALAACELNPEMRNRIPRSILNSTRTKEGEPGEPAKPKVDTIMFVELLRERLFYGVDNGVNTLNVYFLYPVRIAIPRNTYFVVSE